MMTSLTKDDFNNSKWQDIIDTVEDKMCLKYSERFFQGANEISDNDKYKEILSLMGNISSFVLKYDSIEKPFSPFQEWYDRENQKYVRTPSIEDLNDSHYNVLQDIVSDIKDDEMRARVSDILWVHGKDYYNAKIAVEAYIKSSKLHIRKQNKWVGLERINRALILAKWIGIKSKEFNYVIDNIENITNEQIIHADLQIELIKLLLQYRRGDPSKYILVTKSKAEQAELEGRWSIARDFWGLKAKYHVITDDKIGERDSLLNYAGTYVKESHDAIIKTPADYFLAAYNLINAIDAYQKIKNTQDIVKELYKSLSEYQGLTKNQYFEIQANVDLTNTVKQAREKVKGKPFTESLLLLTTIMPPLKAEQIKREIIDLSTSNPMKFLVVNTINDEYNREIARIPPLLPLNNPESEKSLKYHMFRQAQMYYGTLALGVIEPARLQIIEEHKITLEDLQLILKNNPLIPEGREIIYAKGFLAGFYGNYLEAMHLLIPQIENSIRFILEQQGVITSKLNQYTIQEPYSLNRTIEMQELKSILGEDIVFNLNGLLISPYGPNIRNRLAHGRLDNLQFEYAVMSYIWWLSLHLCCLPTISKRSNS